MNHPKNSNQGVTRRETLQAGALSALGALGMSRSAAANVSDFIEPGKAKSVIVLYLLGGAPTQDMYDLKPNAPKEIRGEFNPIATNVPGIDICELLPLTARWMHKSAIVRSVTHDAGCHNTLASYTGFEQKLPNITITEEHYPPSMGSICEYLREQQGGDIARTPAYVYLPCYLGWGQSIQRPGPYGGFLGKRYDPLFTVCDPYVDNPPEKPYEAHVLRGKPQVPFSTLSEGMTLDRLSARRNLLQGINDERFKEISSGAVTSFNKQSERAWSILTSSAVRSAFDFDSEDPETLKRYGNTLFGASTLAARKLVEAGVQYINVTWDIYWERLKLQFAGWDTHANNFVLLRDYNLPYLDLTYNALMQDLDERGLLDETLVVTMSDFGRTPKVNGNAGRDHWTFCYSVMFSGAGIKGGTVFGASDMQAAYVQDQPVSTGDVCATIYKCLGIDPHYRVLDRVNRPIEIAHGGEPIAAIMES
ncbi:MAG: DUF1501 domain-containing protein [Planctomycetota bacterium]|nr:DUF1501 domain-containing protein [Planctomycetota bacterium]